MPKACTAIHVLAKIALRTPAKSIHHRINSNSRNPFWGITYFSHWIAHSHTAHTKTWFGYISMHYTVYINCDELRIAYVFSCVFGVYGYLLLYSWLHWVRNYASTQNIYTSRAVHNKCRMEMNTDEQALIWMFVSSAMNKRNPLFLHLFFLQKCNSMFKHSLLSVRRLLIGINDTQRYFLNEALYMSSKRSSLNRRTLHCRAIQNALGRGQGCIKITTTRQSLQISELSLDENVVILIMFRRRKRKMLFLSFYDMNLKTWTFPKQKNHLTLKVLYRISELWYIHVFRNCRQLLQRTVAIPTGKWMENRKRSQCNVNIRTK